MGDRVGGEGIMLDEASFAWCVVKRIARVTHGDRADDD